MDIQHEQSAEGLVLHVAGRLDAYWADHLERELSEAVRGGARHIRLDASKVEFLSSAGIRILIKVGRELKGIGGSFAVAEPSEPVRQVLEMSGLLAALTSAEAPAAAKAAAGAVLQRDGMTFTVSPVEPAGRQECRLVGSPAFLLEPQAGSGPGAVLAAAADTLIVGVGVLGDGRSGASEHCGEVLAVGGAAVYQPTGYGAVPDYLLAAGTFVPPLTALYGLMCRGGFSHTVAFEPQSPDTTLAVSTLASVALDVAGTSAAVVVVEAETAGLVGASLKGTLAEEQGASFFDFPSVRDRLSFAPDHAWPRSVALVAGVVARDPGGPLCEFVRPMSADESLFGHLHGASFAYRALPSQAGGVTDVVSRLFASEGPQGLLHLIRVDSAGAGVAESEFTRGSLWIGPIDSIAQDGTRGEQPA